MQLSEFLQVDDGGFIGLKGHRIGLHHVVREYNEGLSAEGLQARFPTLALPLIHKVIAFYLENQDEVDRYITGHDAEIDRQAAASKPVPNIVELRRRLEAMRQAELKPAPVFAPPEP